MKKVIYFIVFLFIVFGAKMNIEALSYGGCEYSEISKLRSYVSNINISYDYKTSIYEDSDIENVHKRIENIINQVIEKENIFTKKNNPK